MLHLWVTEIGRRANEVPARHTHVDLDERIPNQMIVATARLQDATILTKDKLLRNYPHVKTLW